MLRLSLLSICILFAQLAFAQIGDDFIEVIPGPDFYEAPSTVASSVSHQTTLPVYLGPRGPAYSSLPDFDLGDVYAGSIVTANASATIINVGCRQDNPSPVVPCPFKKNPIHLTHLSESSWIRNLSRTINLYRLC